MSDNILGKIIIAITDRLDRYELLQIPCYRLTYSRHTTASRNNWRTRLSVSLSPPLASICFPSINRNNILFVIWKLSEFDSWMLPHTKTEKQLTILWNLAFWKQKSTFGFNVYRFYKVGVSFLTVDDQL